LVTALTATLLALALAQGTPAPPPRPGEGGAPPEGGEAEIPPATPPVTTEEPPVPLGIPYMPEVGAPRRTTDGLHLAVGLLSELRTRTLTSESSTTWGTDVEFTPGVALELGTPVLMLSLGYAPRLTIPFGQGGFEIAVLNRATLRAEWRVDPLWTVSAFGVFVVGDYSQLVPASTPGGPGPPPPNLNPVRTFQTYPYVGIDTLARVDGTLSPRLRLRLAGGYFDVGGTGTVGEANQPRTWGPQAEVAVAWDASRAATLTTSVAGKNFWLSGSDYTLVSTLTESWRQVWTPDLETTLAAGVGLSNREVESQTAANHVVPVARLGLVYQTRGRQYLRLSVDAGLAPYFDVYEQVPYQRVTLGLGAEWRPSENWSVALSFSGALAPYSLRVPESYGTTGASASYAPLKFLILSAGAFLQSQFAGSPTTTGNFNQWTLYLSIALSDRIDLQ
jgi:hypothetical protein